MESLKLPATIAVFLGYWQFLMTLPMIRRLSIARVLWYPDPIRGINA